MKLFVHFFLFFTLLAIANLTQAAGSMLRVSCENDGVGAEVLINGKFRGECPIDLQVPEGRLMLLVRKTIDAQRERVFKQDIRMGEGAVKKISAQLGEVKLNADALSRKVKNSQRVKGLSFEALQKDAAAGNTEAMIVLGGYYYDGTNGAPKNTELGTKWIHKAAEAGDVDAMQLFSAILADENDPVQSAIWQIKAAETGDASAMLELAKRYSEEGNSYHYPKRLAEAFRWYRRAAEQGDAAAMYLLGRAYANGEGVISSEEQAIYWWRKAAEAEYPIKAAITQLERRGLR